MRVVLDANVLVSGLPATSNPPSVILELWRDSRFDAFTSASILASAQRAIAKPYWQRHPEAAFIAKRLEDIAALLTPVEPMPGIHGMAEDEEDDLVLATAVAAQADYLVTGDRYLLAIGEFDGIPIISARDFLTMLLGFDPNSEP